MKNFKAWLGTLLICGLMMASIALAATDLNTASQSELEALPGVGPKVAQQIIAHRPFKSIDDLKSVKGLGDKKIQKLAPMVTVGMTQGTTAASNTANTAANTMNNTAHNAENTANTNANAVANTAGNTANTATNTAGSTANTAANTMSNTAATHMAGTHMTKGKLAPGETININTASKEDLERLPGIGDKKADAIIQGRPYKTPEDVMKVKGIKQGVFNKLRGSINTG